MPARPQERWNAVGIRQYDPEELARIAPACYDLQPPLFQDALESGGLDGLGGLDGHNPCFR